MDVVKERSHPMIRAQSLGLPGEFRLRIGTASDYRTLARFHYVAAAPASFNLVCAIDYIPGPARRRIIAVGVLSYPSLNCRPREDALRLGKVPREWRWAYLNRHLRTISRVIVHPQFRGIGLATATVRFLIQQCPTTHIEAISRLALHHPLFERAGMDHLSPGYFLYRRNRQYIAEVA
jgi:GNAT superfamily N-acetyltransferase